jgi:hypothetical protein
MAHQRRYQPRLTTAPAPPRVVRPLGTIVSVTWDADGYERRERVEAIAECPTCGRDVELVADTEAWQFRGGRWRHTEYGPATGECCDLVIVDSFDRCIVLDFTRRARRARRWEQLSAQSERRDG